MGRDGGTEGRRRGGRDVGTPRQGAGPAGRAGRPGVLGRGCWAGGAGPGVAGVLGRACRAGGGRGPAGGRALAGGFLPPKRRLRGRAAGRDRAAAAGRGRAASWFRRRAPSPGIEARLLDGCSCCAHRCDSRCARGCVPCHREPATNRLNTARCPAYAARLSRSISGWVQAISVRICSPRPVHVPAATRRGLQRALSGREV